MKAAPKTLKPKRQEEQASFISWRFALLCGCILIALGFLLGRVAWLQVISPDMLVRQGDMRSLRVQEVSTARGMITDRSGRPLAVSVPVKAIWADPKELHDAGGVTLDNRWKALADALNMPLDQLASRINTNPRMRFIYLARQVNPDMADYIKKLKLPGIHMREESRRYYPSGEVTAHLIGFTNVDSQGIEGVEKSFDKWLTGQPGERIVRKDRYGRVIEDISSTDSQAAHNLHCGQRRDQGVNFQPGNHEAVNQPADCPQQQTGGNPYPHAFRQINHHCRRYASAGDDRCHRQIKIPGRQAKQHAAGHHTGH